MSGDFVDREAYEAALSPVDPSTPEREARAMLDAIHAEFMSVGRGAGASASTLAQCERDWTQWANAYAAAVRARALADVQAAVEGCKRYRGIKQSVQRNGDMVRWTWPADEERHRYCANVLDRNEVLALLAKLREAK